MHIKIAHGFQLHIYGFGSTAESKDYAGTAFKLSGKMWEVVKTRSIKNKGMNIWVYEPGDKVFAGVELENPDVRLINGLEEKKVYLDKYAYCKHIGPYHLIKRVGQNMIKELARQGIEVMLPYVEIYGHWTSDENELETELLMHVK